VVDSPHPEDVSQPPQASRWDPGHYYSPIPDLGDVRRRHAELFESSPRSLPGIDLRAEEQIALVREMSTFYAEMPFTEVGDPSLRYKFDNIFFSYGDAVILYSMLRLHRPPRHVEIGSGW
jgi:hypothetical protein